jgi:hypothetical protein
MWGRRAYVELDAGAAYSRIRGTQKIILGSPLQAAAVEHPFDKYIFCEAISENLEAQKIRVIRHFPAANVTYVEGDCDLRASDILAEIPPGSTGNTVLTLGFAVPQVLSIGVCCQYGDIGILANTNSLR